MAEDALPRIMEKQVKVITAAAHPGGSLELESTSRYGMGNEELTTNPHGPLAGRLKQRSFDLAHHIN